VPHRSLAVTKNEVDRQDRKVLDDPSDGGLDASPDVSAVQIDLLRDERRSNARNRCRPRPERGPRRDGRSSSGKSSIDTVVREQPIVLAERVRVRNRQPPSRRVTDVRDECSRGDLLRFRGELAVSNAADRLLLHMRPAVRIKKADSGPIRVPVALKPPGCQARPAARTSPPPAPRLQSSRTACTCPNANALTPGASIHLRRCRRRGRR